MPVTTTSPHPPGLEDLRRQDPEMADVILGERERQASTLQLIAAENFTSPTVLAALGSPLANKYAEGYPGARYHGGCELVDVAERIACERATKLFGADHANVRPHSGSSAVLAAYAAGHLLAALRRRARHQARHRRGHHAGHDSGADGRDRVTVHGGAA